MISETAIFLRAMIFLTRRATDDCRKVKIPIETMNDVTVRLSSIFRSKAYLKKADTAHNNWIEVPIIEVTARIITFFSEAIT